MIPLRDSIPSRTIPFVNYAMIAICSLVFLAQLTAKDGGRKLIEQFGMVPARVSNPDVESIVIEQRVAVPTDRGIQEQIIRQELAPAAIAPVLTIITCMFLHGGWMHFLGNVWFLYVFGDNVEDRLGHIGYLLMYLATGVLASLAHLLTGPESPIPTIGASGAIAGVMGAYAWLYPHSKVLALLPLIVIMQTFVLPAPIFLLIWFGFQIYNGVAAAASGAAGGVAWWALVGGFVGGAAVALMVGRSNVPDDASNQKF